MSNADVAQQIIDGANARFVENKASDIDRLVLLMAYHEDRCDDRHAELLALHNGGGASKKALAGIGATAAAIIAGAAEGLRRVVG